ncbi:hypothetical protein NFI95_07730 [Acetobacteraceae bacterium KSS8]|uniref:precorrin-2 dehydrogenase n=1 Tax=Endosaccharibacter trunci TaxID=2812733 RepID=A0ABT1W630_9PROT|nr:hypothetical protein [Acetobacteraceae bacterium KSS8]
MMRRPPLLPIFLDLDGRIAFLLGDGEAADRRAATLANCGATLRREASRFEPAMLDGCAIAVGAEAPDEALLAMTREARARGIPFNVVDRPALCGFSTPAVVSRPPLQVAIASGGAAPVLARLLRARIETLVPPGFGRLAELADRMQAETRRRLPDVLRRRRMLEQALSGRPASLMLDGREAEAEAAYRDALDAAEAGSVLPERGVVHLIETGDGVPDLLSLRALRLLGEADVILHGPDESAAILELCRRDAARRVVGEDAVPAMRELASRGVKLVRLSPVPGEEASLQGDFDVRRVPCTRMAAPGD